jgi:general secretion pathway protein A
MLAQPALEQLAQRVVARFHLGPLAAEDCRRYLEHRLAVAGHHGALPFDEAAVALLARLSRGVPRRLNLLADRALLGAYASGVVRVDRSIVQRAAAEVAGLPPPPPAWRLPALAGVGLLLTLGTAWAVVTWWPVGGTTDRADAASSSSPPPGGTVERVPSANAAPTAATTAATTAAPTAAMTPTPAATPPASLPAPGANASLPPDAAPRADLPPVHDEASGWRALATWWGAADAGSCPAPAPGLRCFRAASFTLAQIRALDRPGLVSLRGDDPRTTRTVLLWRADDAQVRLLADGRTLALGVAEFGARWQGDFATLWRARGDPEARATAEWMAQQLQGLPGRPEGAEAGPAAEQVRAFQRAQGLVADGVPGALTLMQLNRVLGVAEPRLSR